MIKMLTLYAHSWYRKKDKIKTIHDWYKKKLFLIYFINILTNNIYVLQL